MTTLFVGNQPGGLVSAGEETKFAMVTSFSGLLLNTVDAEDL